MDSWSWAPESESPAPLQTRVYMQHCSFWAMRKRDYTISEECLKELTQVEHIQPCQSHTEGLMRGSYYHYLSLLPLHLAQCWAVYTVVPSKCFFNLNVYCCRWDQCELTLRRFLKLNLANISTFARAPELALKHSHPGMWWTACVRSSLPSLSHLGRGDEGVSDCMCSSRQLCSILLE